MVTKKMLLKEVGEEYKEMINQISIPDFTKCIAYYAALDIVDVPDSVIIDYLARWAVNKKKFFDMLGGRVRLDNNIQYVDNSTDYEVKYNDLEMEYPVYAPWFEILEYPETMKIKSYDYMSRENKQMIKRIFPHYTLEGSSVVHFFKKCLNAPDDVITKIALIYEHKTISATLTVSIDPVDMMLASENPYNWTSCYRLEPYNDCSHADGCLAAVIDNASLITYLWNKEGEFSLEDFYFKTVRYKRMRRWVSIGKEFNVIHFNDIYPSRDKCPQDFNQKWRSLVEEIVCNYTKATNLWVKNGMKKTIEIKRRYLYGYDESRLDSIFYLKEDEDSRIEDIEIYNEEIICPCGCGVAVPGTDDEWYSYTGSGLVAEAFEEEYPEEDEEEPWATVADDDIY